MQNNYNWQQVVREWLSRRRDSTPEIAEECVRFFQKAFEHTARPNQSWFGTTSSSVSLVVGGIYLASIVSSGEKGFWLLVDTNEIEIKDWSYQPASATLAYTPLYWLHANSLENVFDILLNTEIWSSYKAASDKIFHSAISKGWEETLKERKKKRLSEFWEVRHPIEISIAKQEESLADQFIFDPDNLEDARYKISKTIVQRRGQPEFRNKLLIAYEGKCAVTGFDAEAALEAAHIIQYKGPQTNHVANGILLRADLHTLFDLGLWSVDTETMRVVISPKLQVTSYASLADMPLFQPKDPQSKPSIEALNHHRAEAGL